MSSNQNDTVKVSLGGREVTVPKGGLYDRYRMNPNLDEIARDPRVSSVDFFRALPKIKVDSPIGPTLTPNFYYTISTARLTMLAPTRAIRARLPEELSPLEITPGLGLVSVMFFRYDVADIDFYTEAAVGIAVKPARHGKLGFFDLVSGLKNEHLNSYVLSLPVNSDIAQVRAGFAVAVALGHAGIALLLVLAFALTTLQTLFDNAATALLPSLVPAETLAGANARL
ncbi:acetoacetate decarboxylase, partial [Streptomyces massasporeus]